MRIKNFLVKLGTILCGSTFLFSLSGIQTETFANNQICRVTTSNFSGPGSLQNALYYLHNSNNFCQDGIFFDVNQVNIPEPIILENRSNLAFGRQGATAGTSKVTLNSQGVEGCLLILRGSNSTRIAGIKFNNGNVCLEGNSQDKTLEFNEIRGVATGIQVDAGASNNIIRRNNIQSTETGVDLDESQNRVTENQFNPNITLVSSSAAPWQDTQPAIKAGLACWD